MALLYQGSSTHFIFPIKRSYSKAIKWLKKTKKHKTDPSIQYQIAILSIEDRPNTPSKIKKGFKLLKKIAKTGYNDAVYKTAEYYHDGFYVPRNNFKALKWYEKLASKCPLTYDDNYQLLSTLLALGSLYKNGEGVIQDHLKATEYYEKAIECYEKFTKDSKSDRVYLSLYLDAHINLASLYKQLTLRREFHYL